MSELLSRISSRWSEFSLREQRMILVCLPLFFLFAIYWGIIQPISQSAENAEVRVGNEKQLLQWVTDKADRIVELRAQTGIDFSSEEQLNQVISTSATRYKIELIRIQPRDNMMQVWVQPVQFNQLIHWLAYLQQNQGVQVEFMDLSSTDTDGIVDVKRLQLKRGG